METIIPELLYIGKVPSEVEIERFGLVIGFGDRASTSEKYLHIEMEDSNTVDLALLQPAVEEAVERIQGGEKVLVHCREGMNRSGLVCALILTSLLGVSGVTAARVVRSARPGALYNQAYLAYLATIPGGDGLVKRRGELEVLRAGVRWMLSREPMSVVASLDDEEAEVLLRAKVGGEGFIMDELALLRKVCLKLFGEGFEHRVLQVELGEAEREALRKAMERA